MATPLMIRIGEMHQTGDVAGMDINGLWGNLLSKRRRCKRPACAGEADAKEDERADATNEDGTTRGQFFRRRTSPFVARVLCHSGRQSAVPQRP